MITAVVVYKIIGVLVASQLFLLPSLISVEHGYRGLTNRGGHLLKTTIEPGYNLKYPMIDSVQQVQVTMQTDKVTNIPCGTIEGVNIMFEKIEVVNILDKEHVYSMVKHYGINYDTQLIFDKVHHEMNQFCSKHTVKEVHVTKFDQIDEILKKALVDSIKQTKHTEGLEIISVRVTKPILPNKLKQAMEDVITQQKVQKGVEIKAETEKKRAVIEAEKAAAIQKIKTDALVLEKENLKQISAIEDATIFAREKSRVDAETYQKREEAAANKEMLTPEYLELKKSEAISKNTKMYFGPDIPTMFNPMMSQPSSFEQP